MTARTRRTGAGGAPRSGPGELTGRIKIEINTREHFSVRELERIPHRVESRWFAGEAPILTYALDEMLGTKLRALYQRKKGRVRGNLRARLCRRGKRGGT